MHLFTSILVGILVWRDRHEALYTGDRLEGGCGILYLPLQTSMNF